MLDDRRTTDSTRTTRPQPARGVGVIDVYAITDGLVLSLLILPSLAVLGSPVFAAWWYVGLAGLIGIAACAASLRVQTWRWSPLVGLVLAAASCWLLAQLSYAFAALLVAPMVGLSIALILRRDGALRVMLGVAVFGALMLAVVRALSDRDLTMIVGVLIAAVGSIAALRGATGQRRLRRSSGAFIAAALSIGVLTTAYIGATTPTATWFGPLTSHGPRDRQEVALTFDDGPNPPYTLQIRDILDEHDVKGTFFTVGKALEARPDVSKALLEDGHLLGNHSYHHDAFRWLDPNYAELGDTQDAFHRTLGVCPAFFRPPHGTHTPFMSQVVSDHGMTTVTWDVSAADWATQDAALVAKRVLDKVKPGSIILLHDGIDGDIGADRNVVVQALPLILDGLKEKGLKPVRLDELLGKPAYLSTC